MNIEEPDLIKPRPYRQTARAEAAVATRQRIVEVFLGFLRERWLDDIMLNEVAEAAGVTVQTVIRRFANKEGLLKAAVDVLVPEVLGRRTASPGELRLILEALVRDYDADGDMMLRCLAQEGRVPMMQILLTTGRAEHRGWVEQSFRPWLADLSLERYEQRVLQLIVLTDVYTWKLLRRDQGRTPEETVDLMLELITRLLAEPAGVSSSP